MPYHLENVKEQNFTTSRLNSLFEIHPCLMLIELLKTLDAVGSWQIILPMPKSERAYKSDKESEVVL